MAEMASAETRIDRCLEHSIVAELKTKATSESVNGFLGRIENGKLRADCVTISKLMREATKARPKMWGSSIVGFGSYHYKYASGRQADWFLTGFSPRKQYLTLYIMPGFKKYAGLLNRLGKHKTAKSCLYIKNLDEIDPRSLRQLISQSVKDMIKAHA